MKYFYLCFAVLFLTYSCGSDCNVNYNDLDLDSFGCLRIDSIKRNSPDPSLENINIFLETSGSMDGYMPSNGDATEFQIIIADLLQTYSSDFNDAMSFYSVYNQETPFEKIVNSNARDKILHGDFNWSGSTYLPIMIDSINKKYQKGNNVNILVSDMIYSPEKRDSKNVELTTTDIRELTKSLSKDYISALFSFNSSFRNRRGTIRSSPFYLLIQGKQENVNLIRNSIQKASERLEYKYDYLEFGSEYPNFYYTVLPYTEASPNFIAMPCEEFNDAYISLQDIDIDNSQPMVFWLGVDLLELPNYTQDVSYLSENLNLELLSGNAKVLEVKEVTELNISQDDVSISERCTHFIQIEVSLVNDCISLLNVSLKYTRPDWVDIKNENINEHERSKTFGLSNVISGFEQAYNQDQNAFLFKDISIILNKN